MYNYTCKRWNLRVTIFSVLIARGKYRCAKVQKCQILIGWYCNNENASAQAMKTYFTVLELDNKDCNANISKPVFQLADDSFEP